ncbi:MAG: hypothetical protein COA44_06760 [Arcobacter sp.]|nr:MAG: hypothetical protein COA44_06760 [Arcobacter sp.]
MQLQSHNNTVTVKGNIASVSDFESIKSSLAQTCENHKTIVLKIYDSLVINSSLIGYLVKIVNQDGVRLNLQAGNEVLFELLDDLGLAQTFHLERL